MPEATTESTEIFPQTYREMWIALWSRLDKLATDAASKALTVKSMDELARVQGEHQAYLTSIAIMQSVANEHEVNPTLQ